MRKLIALHYFVAISFLILLLLILFTIFGKKSWTGLNVMMFSSTLSFVGYQFALVFAGFFPNSRELFQLASSCGFLAFELAIALCISHLYITWTLRMLNIHRIFPYILLASCTLTVVVISANVLDFGSVVLGGSRLTLFSVVFYALLLFNFACTVVSTFRCRLYTLRYPNDVIFHKAWVLSRRLIYIPLWQFFSKIPFVILLMRYRLPWPECYADLVNNAVTLSFIFGFSSSGGVMALIYLSIDAGVRSDFDSMLLQVPVVGRGYSLGKSSCICLWRIVSMCYYPIRIFCLYIHIMLFRGLFSRSSSNRQHFRNYDFKDMDFSALDFGYPLFSFNSRISLFGRASDFRYFDDSSPHHEPFSLPDPRPQHLDAAPVEPHKQSVGVGVVDDHLNNTGNDHKQILNAWFGMELECNWNTIAPCAGVGMGEDAQVEEDCGDRPPTFPEPLANG